MAKYKFLAVIIIIAGLVIGYFDVLHTTNPESFLSKPFKLGLDLRGGVHLVYKADVSEIKTSEIAGSMQGLQDVIERRINLFGVAEPLVQIEEKGILKSVEYREQRLIIELPGVTDTNEAIKMIGETPFLEFRLENPEVEITDTTLVTEVFDVTDLTGRFLQKSILEFDPTTMEPQVGIEFNEEGGEIFAKITEENVGKKLAIFLDGAPISTPVIRSAIENGKAQISGQFSPDEARTLVQRLNSGALPVPISLISQQQVGPSLGEKVINNGLWAGIYGIIAVMIFLILWYRLPGFVAVVALAIYVSLMLAIFKTIPVTITAAGIVGFILSIGMAVDANVLIFERMKEEMADGKSLSASISDGFDRAWPSVRDSNVSSLITAVILYWMGTSMVQGFALTYGIGILMSMFSAIVISRILLLSLGVKGKGKLSKFMFNTK